MTFLLNVIEHILKQVTACFLLVTTKYDMYVNYPDPTMLYLCCLKDPKSFQKLNLTAFSFLFPLFFLFFFSEFLISKHLHQSGSLYPQSYPKHHLSGRISITQSPGKNPSFFRGIKRCGLLSTLAFNFSVTET